ncbi:dr1-associated corepressor isoform X2 [Pimephales promelas]|nr:dr1-associated corepressor isoform X2 [Pimephales promelas]KAG1925045.1 dr1-associated corepressor [Pimephales promelas]
MQTDEEIGKVAAAVPVIISRALELFLDSLLTKACHVTQSRNAKTMTTSHLKQCIELEQQFDFLKDLVASVPDMQGDGDENHTDTTEKIPRRGRKIGSGRKNGGAGAKSKDKKLSGTESEQEDDSEDSETEGDEDDDRSQTSTNTQPASFYHSVEVPPAQAVSAGSQQGALSGFSPHPSLMGVFPPAPAPDPLQNHTEDGDDEDYDS